MPKPMRKYKADITSELQRDELEKLRERVKDLEGHRERWRRLAWRYLDALEGLSRAAATILVQPVREPFLVPLEMRSALQDARNRAEQTIVDDEEGQQLCKERERYSAFVHELASEDCRCFQLALAPGQCTACQAASVVMGFTDSGLHKGEERRSDNEGKGNG